MFNNKLNTTAEKLLNQYQGLKLVVFDIYTPLLELVMKPSDNGNVPKFRSMGKNPHNNPKRNSSLKLLNVLILMALDLVVLLLPSEERYPLGYLFVTEF